MTKVRLFPLLIACSFLALGIRSFDIYSGVNILGASAVAQEAPQDTN